MTQTPSQCRDLEIIQITQSKKTSTLHLWKIKKPVRVRFTCSGTKLLSTGSEMWHKWLFQEKWSEASKQRFHVDLDLERNLRRALPRQRSNSNVIMQKKPRVKPEGTSRNFEFQICAALITEPPPWTDYQPSPPFFRWKLIIYILRSPVCSLGFSARPDKKPETCWRHWRGTQVAKQDIGHNNVELNSSKIPAGA